jgi:hypothetical protein
MRIRGCVKSRHCVRIPWLMHRNLLAYLRDAQADAETEFT